MAVTTEKTKELVTTFGKSEKDTGSPESQVAILTERINDLTEHLKIHNKDFSTRRGLIKMVGRRRRLLNYLKIHREPETYKSLLAKLNLRK
jgi:small subunit ribosomal protein S15